MAKYEGKDHYFDPETGVLKNKLGIEDEEELKKAEEGYLNGLEAVAFSTRAAYYLGEINALHPFREGNGRAQREFINHLAYKNGYFIERNISQEEMIQASI